MGNQIFKSQNQKITNQEIYCQKIFNNQQLLTTYHTNSSQQQKLYQKLTINIQKKKYLVSNASKRLSFQLQENKKESIIKIQKIESEIQIQNIRNEKKIKQKQNQQKQNGKNYQDIIIQRFQSQNIFKQENQNQLIQRQHNYKSKTQNFHYFPTLYDQVNKGAPINTYRQINRASFNSRNDLSYKKIPIKSQSFVKVNKNRKIQEQYELLQRIGQGTFGMVYKAKSLKNNQTVAVKLFKKIMMKKLQKNQKLNTQIQILSTLDHPNVIKIFDVFHTDSLYYVVTEYCSGGNLFQYFVKNGRKIDKKILSIIIKQLLYGLSYLHQKQIIHRDIKLQNIVFQTFPDKCQNNDDIQIKIIDFGLAFVAKYKNLNKDKKNIGTPKYMAPQIFHGTYSTKSDIWSCGVILYALLIGRFPFSGKDVLQIQANINKNQIKYFHSQWKQINTQIQQVFKRMLQKDYLKRASAHQLLQLKWFKQPGIQKFESIRQMPSFCKSIIEYKKQNNLIALTQSYIITKQSNTNRQKKQLIKIFKEIDINQNGVIQQDQLQSAFRQLDKHQNQNKQLYFKQIIRRIDKNQSGKLQLSQFLAALTNRKQLFTEENLMQVFNFLDINNNGFIQKKQLEIAMPDCDQQQYVVIMEDMDINWDDKISKQQFLTYFINLSQNLKINSY